MIATWHKYMKFSKVTFSDNVFVGVAVVATEGRYPCQWFFNIYVVY